MCDLIAALKLDRNINPDGHGKYAIINLRSVDISSDGDVHNAIQLLTERGFLHFGNEGPGEQFFVLKYSDKFTKHALIGYADAVMEEALQGSHSDNVSDSLIEYSKEIRAEAAKTGTRIPD